MERTARFVADDQRVQHIQGFFKNLSVPQVLFMIFIYHILFITYSIKFYYLWPFYDFYISQDILLIVQRFEMYACESLYGK